MGTEMPLRAVYGRVSVRELLLSKAFRKYYIYVFLKSPKIARKKVRMTDNAKHRQFLGEL